MNAKQLLGLIGSIILFVGVFAPIVSIPIMGNMNYFQNGRGDGTIVMVLAVASFVLVLIKNYKWLWFTGLGCLGVMLFTFINLQSKISQIKSGMESQLAGNPFRGIADMAMQSVQIQWGWALLIVGAGLVIASAALKEDGERKIVQHNVKETLNKSDFSESPRGATQVRKALNPLVFVQLFHKYAVSVTASVVILVSLVSMFG